MSEHSKDRTCGPHTGLISSVNLTFKTLTLSGAGSAMPFTTFTLRGDYLKKTLYFALNLAYAGGSVVSAGEVRNPRLNCQSSSWSLLSREETQRLRITS